MSGVAKAARKSKLPKVTQEMVAERMGMQRSSVSNIEKGTQHPSLATLIKMCIILDIDLCRIIGKKAKFQTTHPPAAFVPITADMVTESVRNAFLSKDVLDEALATAFNAYMGAKK